MYKKITTIAVMVALTAPMAFSNTPLITNTTFDGYPAESAFDGWVFAANRFQPATTYVETVQAPDAFDFDTILSPSGNGFEFSSWDDEQADKIETFIFYEYNAGPPGSQWENTTFETGDVIVFKGKMRYTVKDQKTIARAFIKFLGYNEQGWEFQIKSDESRFQDATDTLTAFEMKTSFPDLALNDSFQVVQIGFEATGEFDAAIDPDNLTDAVVYFEDIEAYIEGSESVLWNGYEVDENGWANTGDWMGMVNVSNDPWIWVMDLDSYVLIPADGNGWAFVPVP